MSAFKDISIALNNRVAAYASANTRQVAYEGIEYTSVIGTPFIRPTVLPVSSVQANLGKSGQELHEGIFQIDVFWPTNQAKALPLGEADKIANYFTRGLTLTHNGVNVRIGTASIGAANRDNAWLQIPVLINFHSFTQARTAP